MIHRTNHQIIEGIRNGDKMIIKAFYKRNIPCTRKYILNNSGNQEDVEDVFQDALIFIYQKLRSESIEINCSIHTFFYGVCRNIWFNRLRKKKQIVSYEKTSNQPKKQNPDIIDQIVVNERENLYLKHFLKLSTSNQKLLRLCFEGKKTKEIAKIMGYTEGYIRKKKFESKKALLEMIEKDPLYFELK